MVSKLPINELYIGYAHGRVQSFNAAPRLLCCTMRACQVLGAEGGVRQNHVPFCSGSVKMQYSHNGVYTLKQVSAPVMQIIK